MKPTTQQQVEFAVAQVGEALDRVRCVAGILADRCFHMRRFLLERQPPGWAEGPFNDREWNLLTQEVHEVHNAYRSLCDTLKRWEWLR